MERANLIQALVSRSCTDYPANLGQDIDEILTSMGENEAEAKIAVVYSLMENQLRTAFMGREYMVVSGTQVATAKSVEVAALEMYQGDKRFKDLVDSLTIGIMRIIIDNTSPVTKTEVVAIVAASGSCDTDTAAILTSFLEKL